MTEHTPGPWMSHVDNQSEYTHTITALVRPSTSPIIADIVKHPNSEADARLIAAAPELLEALRNILDALDLGFHELALSKLNAHEAIAKATTPEQ
jgi:hypothetical protein